MNYILLRDFEICKKGCKYETGKIKTSFYRCHKHSDGANGLPAEISTQFIEALPEIFKPVKKREFIGFGKGPTSNEEYICRIYYKGKKLDDSELSRIQSIIEEE